MAYVQVSMIIISVIILLISSGYLVGKTDKKFLLHRVVIGFFLVRAVGTAFKILHWVGADELMAISDIGFALGAFLLIWTGLRNSTRKLLLYQFICGLLAAFMVLVNYWPIHQLASIVRFLPYPLAALAGTIILNKLYVHPGEKNMLIMYFIVAITAVILDLFRLV
jgi:hypothetical protein